jgi:hypothetical protein
MRAWLTVLGAVLLVSGCGGSSATTTTTKQPSPAPHSIGRAPATVTSGLVKATLYAPTRTPEAKEKWRYRVVVTDKQRRKLAGKITVQIVDPLGQAHAVTYDDTPRPIANMAFDGSFHDYVEWPADSRGYTLTFRVIANTPKGQVTITYPVTPK